VQIFYIFFFGEIVFLFLFLFDLAIGDDEYVGKYSFAGFVDCGFIFEADLFIVVSGFGGIEIQGGDFFQGLLTFSVQEIFFSVLAESFRLSE
jgi:hypothetical protein